MTDTTRPSRGEMVGAVADWIDEHGLEALTLDAVSRRLGVDQPVLIDQFGSLAGLAREMRLRALLEIGALAHAAADQHGGTTKLLAIASAVRHFAATHPGLYDATIASTHGTDPELQAAGQQYLGVFVDALSSYRLEQVEVIHSVRSVLSAIHGFVMLGRGGAFGMPIGVDESFAWLISHLSAAFETHA
jgi:AcrR family transcriptional regulator